MNLAALEVRRLRHHRRQRRRRSRTSQFIQPDFFAKGYEYSGRAASIPRRGKRWTLIESYGGELLFTPGDVVFSSSAIIETDTAQPRASKSCWSLLESEGLTFGVCASLALNRVRGIRVHVVGDTIVDSYTYCTLDRRHREDADVQREIRRGRSISPAARRWSPSILREAGADVTFSTVLGDDRSRTSCCKDLEARGIDCHAVIDPTRPTTQKNAFIANGYRMLKVDKSTTARSPRRSWRSSSRRWAGTRSMPCLQRFPARHLQQGHDSAVDRGDSRTGRCAWPTARWRTAGATSSTSRVSI